jgi:hypothetical protein
MLPDPPASYCLRQPCIPMIQMQMHDSAPCGTLQCDCYTHNHATSQLTAVTTPHWRRQPYIHRPTRPYTHAKIQVARTHAHSTNATYNRYNSAWYALQQLLADSARHAMTHTNPLEFATSVVYRQQVLPFPQQLGSLNSLAVEKCTAAVNLDHPTRGRSCSHSG